ncbi:MAG: hypothetical protein QM730_20740 [Anaerolineales bacterium]
MTDVILFLQQGWKNIWKQGSIWLLSAVPFLNQLLGFLYRENSSNSLLPLLFFVGNLVTLVVFLTYLIGVPYLVYSLSVGQPATMYDALLANRKYAGRVIGCLFLLLLPCGLLGFIVFSINRPVTPQSLFSTNSLILLPLVMFRALWDFSLFSFFSNNWGIQQNIKRTWTLFMDHFVALILLGTVLALLYRLFYTLAAAITILTQSNFQVTSITLTSYLNPSVDVRSSLLFIIITGIGQTLYTPISTAAFASAYVKYSGIKISSAVRQK